MRAYIICDAPLGFSGEGKYSLATECATALAKKLKEEEKK